MQIPSNPLPSPFILVGPKEATLEKAISLTEKSPNDPDLFTFAPEEKSSLYAMDTIKDFIQDAALPPYVGECKFYIFQAVDKMLPIHANALLKTLEEHLPSIVIILLTNHLDLILPTITSRCQIFHLNSNEQVKQPQVDGLIKQIELAINSQNYIQMTELIEELEPLLKEDEALFDYTLQSILELAKRNTPDKFHEIALSIDTAKTARLSHIRIKHILEYLFLKPFHL